MVFLYLILDEKYLDEYYSIVNLLRDNNINSEIYLDPNKNMKKQLAYAIRRGFSLAIICGQDEIDQNKATIEKLKSKDENKQFTVSRENLINEIKNYNKVFNILKRKYFKYIELDPVIESKFILQRSGENFKKYLFSFYNSDGQELSLRPDLTISSVIDMHTQSKSNKKEKFLCRCAFRKSYNQKMCGC